MWPVTRFTRQLQVRIPVVLGGMAGGPTTPRLVAAVSNAGGLGTLGAGYMTPDQIEETIREIRTLTDAPFAVNLFAPEQPSVSRQQLQAANNALCPIRDKFGLMEPVVQRYAQPFDQQLDALLAARVPVFSFTFGIPPAHQLDRLKEAGIQLMGTATTVREAQQLQAAGVDMIVAQGAEAGGHRGTFLSPADGALVGTLALVPQVVDAVSVPVIAAGGIADGRGIVAAFALGAEAVQMGTAFLVCEESGAHPAHKAAVLASTDESTRITTAFSGKPARGIQNEFMKQMEPHMDAIAPYPVQNALTRDIRKAAAAVGNDQYMSLWAGQAAHLGKPVSAAELVAMLERQVGARLRQLTEMESAD